MAHECPDCGQSCYCGGDIDDCFFEESEEARNCRHCPYECGPECNCEDKYEQDEDCIEDEAAQREQGL